MQIRSSAINTANTTAARGVLGKAVKPATGAPMPQCRITLSKEGRELSRQKSAQGAEVKLMLRQSEEAAQTQKTMDMYREKLRDINKELDSINRSFNRNPDKETIEKQQELLDAMHDQKAAQMEANNEYAKKAQELAAMQSAQCQEEIDGKNRELWTFLKTLEEAEKSKEERENGVADEENDADTSETGSSLSDTIQNSAVRFNKESIRRELGVNEEFEQLSAEGHGLISQAGMLVRETMSEGEYISKTLEAGELTDDAKAEAEKFQSEISSVYQDVERYRSNGLYLLQAVRDAKLKRIADDPLDRLQETKDSIMLSADRAVLGAARQERLDRDSEKLEDDVEELIDERNDTDKTEEKTNKEKEEEEQELKDLDDEETDDN